jgi:hypothetical protein
VFEKKTAHKAQTGPKWAMTSLENAEKAAGAIGGE